jgi:hypothetical protein
MAALNDGSDITGWGSASAVDGYIQLSFYFGNYPVFLKGVALRQLSPIALGVWGATYLNGALLQISDDDITWNTLYTLSGFTDYGEAVYFGINSPTSSVRVFHPAKWIGISEFYLHY